MAELNNGKNHFAERDVEQDPLLRALQEQQWQHEKHIEEQQRQHENHMEVLLEQHLDKIVDLLTRNAVPASSSRRPQGCAPDRSCHSTVEAKEKREVVHPNRSGSDLELPPSNRIGKNARPTVSRSGTNQTLVPRMRISQQEAFISSAKLGICQEDPESHIIGTIRRYDQPETQGHVQRCAEEIVQHWAFQAFVMLLIVCSTFGLGLDTEWSARYPGEEFPHMKTINLCLSAFFFLEITLRIASERAFFLSWNNEGVLWNLLDSILVVLSVSEEIYSRVVHQNALVDVSQTRLLRCFRLVKAVRLIRILRFFQDLRVMVMGILTSMKSLVFAVLLMNTIMYMIAVCILQFTVEYMQTHDDDISEKLRFYVGDVGDTTYTLFACITSGYSWCDVGNALFELNWFLGMVFVFYIAFGTLCVLNIITGVFVESAMKNSEADDHAFMLQELEEKKMWIDQVKTAFLEADSDNNGTLNLVEFTSLCDQRNMRIMLTKLGVDLCQSTPAQLFKLMDLDDSNVIDVNDFAAGLLSMRGNAKSLDVALLQRSIKRVQTDVARMYQCFRDVQEEMLLTRQEMDQAAAKLGERTNSLVVFRL